MKKFLASILAVVMPLSLIACGETKTGEQTQQPEKTKIITELVAGTSAPEGSTIDTLMNHITDTIGEATDGAFSLKHYGASQLGGDSDMVTEVQSGNVDITAMTTASLVGVIPQLAVFDMQGAIPNTEVLTRMMADKEFNETIQSWFENAGYHLLTYCPSCSKGLGTNKYIDNVSVFSNYTMRVLANQYHIAFWEAVGANTIQIPAGELYLSLQQGMADGLEMDMHGFIKFNCTEVLDYIYDARLLMHMSVVVMNLDKWNSIDSAEQEALTKYFSEITEYYIELGKTDDEESWKEAYEAGVEKIEFNQEVFDELKAVSEENVWPMVRKNVGDDVVDVFLAAVERNS